MSDNLSRVAKHLLGPSIGLLADASLAESDQDPPLARTDQVVESTMLMTTVDPNKIIKKPALIMERLKLCSEFGAAFSVGIKAASSSRCSSLRFYFSR